MLSGIFGSGASVACSSDLLVICEHRPSLVLDREPLIF
jgi:hypothetical protein